MSYRLAVDLGTTFTAAAVAGDGASASLLGLGGRSMQVPSVLFLDDSGAFLVGEAAERRGPTNPSRLVREFKRRLGDDVPVMVDGQPYESEALGAELLRWVVDRAVEQQGERPAEAILTHPAAWGTYRLDRLRRVASLAGLDRVSLVTEPEAAGAKYAAGARVAAGDRIAVYDLGGGTFDVCVLEKSSSGFTIMGAPQGVEHLGGADFDEAVFRLVLEGLGDVTSELDWDDPETILRLARLRRDCVEAKEALSSDSDVALPVQLPGVSTIVRLSRAEFESMVRPALQETVPTVKRALRSAGLQAEDLQVMVLVGGSSRIPAVVEILQHEFDVRIGTDIHPKHDFALGALLAGQQEVSSAVPMAAGPHHSPVAATTAPSIPSGGERRRGEDGHAAVHRARGDGVEPTAEAPVETEAGSVDGRDGGDTAVMPLSDSGEEGFEWFYDDGASPRSGSPPVGNAEVRSASTAVDTIKAGSGRRHQLVALLAATVVAGLGIWAVIALRTPVGETTGGVLPTETPSRTSFDLPTGDPLSSGTIIVPMQDEGKPARLFAVESDGSTKKPKSLRKAKESMWAPRILQDRATVLYIYKGKPRVMSADGKVDRALFTTKVPACTDARHTSWAQAAPDHLIVQCRQQEDADALMVVNLDGTLVRQLPLSQLRIDDPSLSPDGNTIVFWASEDTDVDGGAIYTMPVDGSEAPTPLTDVTRDTDADPSWSPNGQQIAFRRSFNVGAKGGDKDVWLMERDGTGLRALGNSRASDERPSWSPDGDELVVVSNRKSKNGEAGKTYDLWVIRVSDGKVMHRLDLDAFSVSTPAWGER